MEGCLELEFSNEQLAFNASKTVEGLVDNKLCFEYAKRVRVFETCLVYERLSTLVVMIPREFARLYDPSLYL